ncbi:MAG: hypothetical protein ACRDG9_06295 [Actinomycetota bacterium]
MKRFLKLRDASLRKRPATGDLLVWLRVLALGAGTLSGTARRRSVEATLSRRLPEDHQDIEDLGSGRGV